MELLLTYGGAELFKKEVTLTELDQNHCNKVLFSITMTPAEREAFMIPVRAAWLASLSPEVRAEYLRVQALPDDERKLEYAKQQQTILQTKLTEVESVVTTMTEAVAAKSIPKTPVEEPLIEP